jgi:hypothetical protein
MRATPFARETFGGMMQSRPNTPLAPEPLRDGELDDADIEGMIATLFEAAIDESTGILVPDFVRGWADVIDAEDMTLEELVGEPSARALEAFAHGYSRPRNSFIQFAVLGSQVQREVSRRQTLRVLARRIRLDGRTAVNRILGAIPGNHDALKRAVGPWASLWPIRRHQVSADDQQRLGL